MRTAPRRLAGGLMCAAGAASALAQAPAVSGATVSLPAHVRGEIVVRNGDVLIVRRGGGNTVPVTMTPGMRVSALRKISLADIKAGEFIGTAAQPGADGKLTAQEVVGFPESARGTGEGHYAWDLGSGDTMTNANVDAVMQSASGQDLTLSYKSGTNTVRVPPTVPVVTFATAERGDLKVGKRVFIVGQSDGNGHYAAQRVVVEKNGVVPPM